MADGPEAKNGLGVTEPGWTRLDDRGVIALSGDDRIQFLQGLVSNDVTAAAPGRAVYVAFLTPQGKFLHDLFIHAHDDRLLIECEAARREDLLRRLKMYRLRSRVALEDLSESMAVHAVFGNAGAIDAAALSRAVDAAGGVAAPDPRLAELGWRVVLPRDTAAEPLFEGLGIRPAEAEAYDLLRLWLGVPEGSRDMVPEKAILLESNVDALGGVSWTKGCYMGQELTARTKYRGLVKKRLLPVLVDGPLPEPGTPVSQDGSTVGEVRSGRRDRALALLRLEAVEAARTSDRPLVAGAARLHPQRPAWEGG